MCDGIIFRSQFSDPWTRCLCSMCNLAGRTQLLYLATLKSMVHGQHMACLISSLHMDNIFKAKVLEDLQDSGSSTTEPKAQEAWQKLPYVLDGKNCYAQKFKKPGKNYQLHSIQHLLLIGVAWFRETIRSYPFFRMYPRKTSGVNGKDIAPMRNWKVDPNACNPFHICASYCFDYLNEGSERRQLQASQALGDVVVDEEAPGSNGVSFLEDQLNIHDVASASNPNLTAQEDESIDAAVAEELDLEISEEAPDNYGEEMTSFS